MSEKNFSPKDRDETAPIQPIGHCNGTFYLLSGSGELRNISGDKLEVGKGVRELFVGRPGWEDFLLENFPARHGWDRRQVGLWIMDRCADKGLISEGTLQIRNTGVWRGEDGRPIVHCGDVLFQSGGTTKAGHVTGSVVFPALPPVAPPADTSADIDDARHILESIRSTWCWARATHADLVIGWLGLAYLGGFPDWRPHIALSGPRGSGKSKLLEILSLLLGPMSGKVLNGNSEASIRQSRNGEARALIIDEAEAQADGTRLDAVIGLLRLMCGGEGAHVTRGTSHHQAKSFNLIGTGLLAAILPPPMPPQDQSRFVTISLEKLQIAKGEASAAMALATFTDEARELGKALWRRMLDQAHRWDTTEQTYKSAAAAMGADPRDAATAAAILAGRDLLLNDTPINEERIEADRPLFDVMLSTSADTDASSEGEQCLRHLFGYQPRLAHGRVASVEELIAFVTSGESATEEDKQALARLGLRVMPAGEGLWILSGQHPQLDEAFKGTRWIKGTHSSALRQLPGVQAARNPVRVGGSKRRAIELPASFLPCDEHEEGG